LRDGEPALDNVPGPPLVLCEGKTVGVAIAETPAETVGVLKALWEDTRVCKGDSDTEEATEGVATNKDGEAAMVGLEELLNDGLPESDAVKVAPEVPPREVEGHGLALAKNETEAIPVAPPLPEPKPPEAEAVTPTPPAPLLGVSAAGVGVTLPLPPLDGDTPLVPDSPPVELTPPLPVPLPLTPLDLDPEPLIEPVTAATEKDALALPLTLLALDSEGQREGKGAAELAPLELPLKLPPPVIEEHPLGETCWVVAGDGEGPNDIQALCDPDRDIARDAAGVCVE
jgi:hypothetical protein